MHQIKVFSAIVLLAFLTSCHEARYASEPKFVSQPNDADRLACEAAGNEYRLIGGIFATWGCVENYPDGGKVCTDGEQCKGDCIVDAGLNEPISEPASGYCEKDSETRGCVAFIEDGRVAERMCID